MTFGTVKAVNSMCHVHRVEELQNKMWLALYPTDVCEIWNYDTHKLPQNMVYHSSFLLHTRSNLQLASQFF